MKDRQFTLPSEVTAALATLAIKLESGKSVASESSRAISLMAELPPGQIARLDGEIAVVAGLCHRPAKTLWTYLMGRYPTDASQLRRETGLKYLFLHHRDGRLREAALQMISGGLPSPFTFATVVWRLNDWAEPVRHAAERCAERSFPLTDANVVAKAASQLLVRQSSWGRWTSGKEQLDCSLARSDVVECLADLIGRSTTGPLASVLRRAAREPSIDGYLFSLATGACQPSVRAVALEALIKRTIEWPSGQAWKWIDKSVGLRRRVLIFDSRSLDVAIPRHDLVAIGIRDRSAFVRRVALDGIISFMKDEPRGRDYAAQLVADRSRSVRERAAFILRSSTD